VISHSDVVVKDTSKL